MFCWLFCETAAVVVVMALLAAHLHVFKLDLYVNNSTEAQLKVLSMLALAIN